MTLAQRSRLPRFRLQIQQKQGSLQCSSFLGQGRVSRLLQLPRQNLKFLQPLRIDLEAGGKMTRVLSRDAISYLSLLWFYASPCHKVKMEARATK